MDREALLRRRVELQSACDAARERMNENAGAVAAYDEVIRLLDEGQPEPVNLAEKMADRPSDKMTRKHADK